MRPRITVPLAPPPKSARGVFVIWALILALPMRWCRLPTDRAPIRLLASRWSLVSCPVSPLRGVAQATPENLCGQTALVARGQTRLSLPAAHQAASQRAALIGSTEPGLVEAQLDHQGVLLHEIRACFHPQAFRSLERHRGAARAGERLDQG